MALLATDLVLSDVHIGGEPCVVIVHDNLVKSHRRTEERDDDEPPRRLGPRVGRLRFDHNGLTTVSEVALQLWRGAFLLSEFVVAHQRRVAWTHCR